jgi:CRISPR-associated protein Cmr3
MTEPVRQRWLVFEPHDTVTVRDGRAFDAGAQSLARARAPHPGTVAGAVGAAYGADPGAGADAARRGRRVPAQVRGPVVVADVGDGWQALFAMPRDVVRDPGQGWRRLTPEPADLAGVCHDAGEVGLLAGDGEPGGWWPLGSLRAYLRDPAGPLSGPHDPPWVVERRVGLARDEDRTARDRMLYAAEHLRPTSRLGFAVCCVDPPELPLRDSVPLGGEGRRAWLRDWPDGARRALPKPLDDFDDGRVLLYLATPAVFTGGWRLPPEVAAAGELVTAAVGAAEPIPMGRPDRRGGLGARRLAWAVPAGSVYLLRITDPVRLTEAAGWHGRCLPQADETLQTAGFGLALIGRW